MPGQYFTKSKLLQEKVYSFILNKPNEILEPSVGRGDLVQYVNCRSSNIKFDMYEIDDKIKDFLVDKKEIKFGDFLVQKIDKKYITIIGNPPYVRTKKGNLYIDFIKKCYSLLEDNGELIFIIPSDFFKLTCTAKILVNMLNDGAFTHIFHPHNENLFEGATIDIIIIRYCKNKTLEKKVNYNDKLMYILNNDGFVTFSEDNIKKNNIKRVSDYFDVYVGFVTGRDDVFQNDCLGNINVLWSRNKIKKFILINKFPSQDKKINQYLLKNKDKLINRKIRKFNENNWYQWGGLRNIACVEKNKNKPCIYLRNMSRSSEIAFEGTVDYFGPGLFMLLPKNSNVNLSDATKYFNTQKFKQDFIYSGRFKIGHKQLHKSVINM
jgi:adenine-specific DNA-methyltransferase